jgi:Tfp pilus assembly protein PilV
MELLEALLALFALASMGIIAFANMHLNTTSVATSQMR